jgi:predicted dehydrogenase
MTGVRASIAVIGCGQWGRNIARSVAQLGHLAGICDAKEVHNSEGLPLDISFLSLEEVLSNTDIKGVMIATPTPTHFSLATQALEAGKHVYVEKPMVATLAENDALENLSQEKDRILMVGHLLRYHPAFLKVQEMVTEGEIGNLLFVTSNRMNLGKIHLHENVLWDFAPHDLSMILALMGKSPSSVLAADHGFMVENKGDMCSVDLKFEGRQGAHIFLSRLSPFKEQKLVVVGDRGMIVFDDTKGWDQKITYSKSYIKWENGIPVPIREREEFIALPSAEPLKLECQHFIDCMTSGKKPRTPGQEARQVLEIIKAAEASLETQSWVSL